MSQLQARSQLEDVSIQPRTLERTMQERLVPVRTRSRGQPPTSLLEEFEHAYQRNVDVLMGYFARRCRDPQTVADLTSETFVRAVDGFARFDPRRGSDRAWLFGIAAHVFAHHCEQSAGGGRARRSRRAHPEGGGGGARCLPGRISETVVPGAGPVEPGPPRQRG
jgi:hypothetical protein